MKMTKRHYYKYFNPKTGEVREYQCERAITITKKRQLMTEGFQKVEEIYWDPFVWKMLKEFAKGKE